MKAMIFAAGLGTRLRPLTDSQPKALVEVGGVPALQRVLERIREAGIRDVVVNVHHFPEKIRAFLRENSDFGLNIAISDESARLLDTGGGLLAALPLLGDDEPVVLYNADIVSDFSIGEMITAYNQSTPDALLLTADRPSSRRLLFDDNGDMRGWRNMTSGETRPAALAASDAMQLTPLAFGGAHIVAPGLFPHLRDYGARNGDVFSITPFYIEACQRLTIKSFMPRGEYRWHDIGSMEKLRAADAAFRQ